MFGICFAEMFAFLGNKAVKRLADWWYGGFPQQVQTLLSDLDERLRTPVALPDGQVWVGAETSAGIVLRARRVRRDIRRVAEQLEAHNVLNFEIKFNDSESNGIFIAERIVEDLSIVFQMGFQTGQPGEGDLEAVKHMLSDAVVSVEAQEAIATQEVPSANEQSVHARRFQVQLARINLARVSQPENGVPLSFPWMETHEQIDEYVSVHGLNDIPDEAGNLINTRRYVPQGERLSHQQWVARSKDQQPLLRSTH